MNRTRFALLSITLAGVLVVAGCTNNPTTPVAKTGKTSPVADAAKTGKDSKDNKPSSDAGEEAEIKAALAKLEPADRKLAEAQKWCAESEERLGTMGKPIKVTIKGEPVFLCCGGCKKSAEANPEKTLAKVAELKKKAAAETKTP
jgi:hypothetical protein